MLRRSGGPCVRGLVQHQHLTRVNITFFLSAFLSTLEVHRSYLKTCHSLAIILLVMALVPCQGQAPPPDSLLIIPHQEELIYLSKYVYFIRDSAAKWDLSEARRRDAEFKPINQEIFATYYDRNVDAYWLRIRIDNRTSVDLNDILYFHPSLDAIDIYQLEPDSTGRHQALSYARPTRDRQVHLSQELATPVTLPPGRTEFYVRALNQSIYSKQLGNIIVNLAERNEFVNFFLRVRYYHGIALGMLFVMLMFHVFIYFFFGGRSYLYFVLNLFVTIVYLYLQKYYHHELPLLAPIYPALRYLHDPFGSLLCITVLLFSQSFLGTRRGDPILNTVMNGLTIALFVVTIAMMLLVQLHLMNIISVYLGLLTSIVVLIASFRSFRRGNRYALYVFFGFLLFLLVPIAYMFPVPGYMSYKNNESDFHYYFEAIRSLIFAVGIADRFNGVRKAANRLETERLRLEIEKGVQLQAERERISRDLHDNIGSQVTNLGLSLNNLEPGVVKSPRITALQDQVDQIMIQLRNTIWVIERDEIRIDEFEIKTRNMIWQFQKANEVTKFDFNLAADPERVITAIEAVNVLRIVQECMQNSVKHSGADTISIRFTVENDWADLICEDNGNGFDASVVLDASHYGLNNIRKRVSELGGTVTFSPPEGRGARVQVLFPFSTRNRDL